MQGLVGAAQVCNVRQSVYLLILLTPFPLIVFSASFGSGGFRTTRVRHNNGPQAAGQANNRSVLIQLLPLIILFAFSLLSNLPNLFATSPTPNPHFSFTNSQRYNTERHTSGLKIRYHVNNVEFSQHPQIAAELAAQSSGNSNARSADALKRFERHVERVYTQDLYNQCQRGLDNRERRKEAEIGFLGFGTDWNRVREIEKELIPSCEEMKKLRLV